MIGAEGFGFENYYSKGCKDQKGNHFLNHLELKQRKGPSITFKAHFVGWYLKDIFEQGDSPADKNDGDKTQFAEPFPFSEFEVAIPSECHKGVGDNQ